MKNVKRIAVIVLSVLVILSAFTACGGKSPDKLIIGSWRDSTGTTGYEFKEDGSAGRTPEIKKAYVTLKEDSKTIEFFDGMAQ